MKRISWGIFILMCCTSIGLTLKASSVQKREIQELCASINQDSPTWGKVEIDGYPLWLHIKDIGVRHVIIAALGGANIVLLLFWVLLLWQPRRRSLDDEGPQSAPDDSPAVQIED